MNIAYKYIVTLWKMEKDVCIVTTEVEWFYYHSKKIDGVEERAQHSQACFIYTWPLPKGSFKGYRPCIISKLRSKSQDKKAVESRGRGLYPSWIWSITLKSVSFMWAFILDSIWLHWVGHFASLLLVHAGCWRSSSFFPGHYWFWHFVRRAF